MFYRFYTSQYVLQKAVNGLNFEKFHFFFKTQREKPKVSLKNGLHNMLKTKMQEIVRIFQTVLR